MPMRRYFYRVGDGVTFSQIYSFTSIAPKGKHALCTAHLHQGCGCMHLDVLSKPCACAGQTYPQRLLLVADWGMSLNRQVARGDYMI
jgi:hypothetical protein